jgi:large subunit ribosomal protein L25
MEKLKIEVYSRERVGKEGAKKVRAKGEIPAVVYGKETNMAVRVPLASQKILRSAHFSESTIITMEVVNGEKKDNFSVLIKDIQYSPLTEAVIHLDFLKVSLEEKIRVHVPLSFKGEPASVKEGAVVEYILRELEIEGYPLDIPEKIEIDISNLEIGHSIHVSDITIAQNLKCMAHLEDTVVTLVAKMKEEEIMPAEAEEEAPEGPEVIKEKKEEGEKKEGEKGEKKESSE